MHLKSLLILVICVLTSSQSPDRRRELIEKERFGAAYKLPEALTPEHIQGLVQSMIDEVYEVGFRYVGVEEDFFHGHVLFTMDELTVENRMKPFAVLYHTQESAKRAHWTSEIDKKYDYLNVQTRNWLQWLTAEYESMKIENARAYVNTKLRDDRIFFEQIQPIKGEAFTIHGRYLDPEKLGVDVVGELQFEFFETPCHVETNSLYTRGPITVFFPSGKKTCLKLSTRSTFIDWQEWPPKPYKKNKKR